MTFGHLFGHMEYGLLLPVHLAIGIGVTVHALLRKREVGSALGWIGLTWLSPFLGGFLYFVLGINRVQRRALRLKRRARVRRHHERNADKDAHDDLEPLQQSIWRISGRLLETGNDITVFQNGDEAYPAMLDAIARATASVGLSTYIFRVDKTGRRFIDALQAAQRRGIEVRVIIDGIGGNWLLSSAYRALRRAGVPAGRFLHSPLPWRMPLVNLRSHKKILVVDGRLAFTGGMNIADENVMRLKPKRPVEDTHFKVVGPVVAQLVDAFADDWTFVADEDLEGEAWFPAIQPQGSMKARVISSGPDNDLQKIELAILQAVACARASIYVMTPYFLPDESVITALSLAAMRGVNVQIVMPARSNHVLVDWAARANIGSLLRDDVHIWLGPDPFRHSKIMVVDGEWALIGSTNWDLRSLRLNFEVCMEVYDQVLAQQLQHFITSNRGEPLTNKELRARPLPVQLRDSACRLMMPYL